MKVILASKSKRRQELLKMINLDYQIIPALEEETVDDNLSPLENCINISLNKALEVKNKTTNNRIIISCDTIVVKDNKVYGKPKNNKEAFDMLKKLSNTSHDVISCLTVIEINNNKERIFQKQGFGKVYIDNLTDEEIINWVDKNKPFDKAGGYAIQEEFGKYISKIEGDYYSIVGLPLNELYRILKELKIV